jgi:expansin (peptidoglycan-binding protein)
VAVEQLWTCPRCGRRFTLPNLWHSCVTTTVDDHLSRVPEAVGHLYRGFAFAIPQQRALRLRLEGPRAIDSPRIVKVERYGRIAGSYLRVVGPEGLDYELAAWVTESYAHGAAGRE